MSNFNMSISFDSSVPDLSIDEDALKPELTNEQTTTDKSKNQSSVIPETDDETSIEDISMIGSSQNAEARKLCTKKIRQNISPESSCISDDSIIENSYCESTKSGSSNLHKSSEKSSYISPDKPKKLTQYSPFTKLDESVSRAIVSSTPTAHYKDVPKSRTSEINSGGITLDCEEIFSKDESSNGEEVLFMSTNEATAQMTTKFQNSSKYNKTDAHAEQSVNQSYHSFVQPCLKKRRTGTIITSDDDEDEEKLISDKVRKFVDSANESINSVDVSSDLSENSLTLISTTKKNKRAVVIESDDEDSELKETDHINDGLGEMSVNEKEVDIIDLSSSEEEDSRHEDIHEASSESGKSVEAVGSTSDLINYSNFSTVQLNTLLSKKQMIAKSIDWAALPDNGVMLLEDIDKINEELNKRKKNEQKNISLLSEEETSSSEEEEQPQSPIRKPYFEKKNTYRYQPPSPERDEIEELPDVSDPIAELEQKIKLKRNIFQASNLKSLEDGGQKLQKEIYVLERELMMMKLKAGADSVVKTDYKSLPLGSINLNLGKDASKVKDSDKYQQPNIPPHVIDALYASDKNYGARDYGGKLSHAREREMVRVTSNVIEDFESILRNMPDVANIDPEELKDPRGLRVTLMPHQKRALHWLLWRETQKPPGGILADDMGLGKTLTMLSLIASHKQLLESGHLQDIAAKGFSDDSDDESENSPSGWLSKNRSQKLKMTKGSLIICPASVIGQWEQEIKRRFYSQQLSCTLYHGTNRDTSVSRLCKFDVVITTYQLAMKEAFGKGGCSVKMKNSDGIPTVFRKDQGSLYQVGWTRIILDEAHVIRNHKSQTAQAICMLKGARRWAVSGTPVQNKEMDMFSLIRFLRISPFDDYTCWKHQIQSGAQGRRKLAMIVKAVLLRRSKDDIDNTTGKALVTLPEKTVVKHMLSLKQQEREIYDRVFAYSRNSLVDYMKTHDQKELEKEKKTSSTGSTFPMVDDNAFTPTLNLMGAPPESEVKTHHLLVLLLRLRQVCCHPFLIKTIVEESEEASNAIASEKENDPTEAMIDDLHNLTVKELDEIEEETGIKEENKVFSLSNPIFDPAEMSSKIEKVVEELAKIKKKGKTNKEGDPDPVNGSREKAVIVSQWTSMLKLVKQHLLDCGLKALSIDGTVPVKERTPIVEEFNNNPKGSKVLLLSLGAGGVGLNLVGANHLFLLDMHWNPQMEKQACDRVYRVGQTRPVTIHRFIVENTVEMKISELQERKLQVAEEVLSGAKRESKNKLTLNDLKELFQVV